MKIATWNVNSINTRINQLASWVKKSECDVILLQELKCLNDAFPYEAVEDLGFNVAVHGQKTYNGVAILSKYPIEEFYTEFAGDPGPSQARFIEGVISVEQEVYRVASVYVPNGQEVGSEKYKYKLDFLDNLFNHIKKTMEYDEKYIVGGDYNVAPENIDVFDPIYLKETLCFSTEEKKALRKILNLGMVDAYRKCFPKDQQFTWWDYRAGAWQKNKGMRIDHLLLSPEASDVLEKTEVDISLRSVEKPSDHVPVIAKFRE